METIGLKLASYFQSLPGKSGSILSLTSKWQKVKKLQIISLPNLNLNHCAHFLQILHIVCIYINAKLIFFLSLRAESTNQCSSVSTSLSSVDTTTFFLYSVIFNECQIKTLELFNSLFQDYLI